MKKRFLFLILLFSNQIFGQIDLQIATLGDFKTIGGDVIKNCKIGYRTIGKLNANKSNAVLWPTWITGTSEDIKFGIAPSIVDTTGLYIIIVDAFGNGVSSSPSNTIYFPGITIRDMVNSQYQLLTQHLKINHLYAVIGISMGGIQAFEWVVAYPNFLDKALPIVGTPKLSFYDLLNWRIQESIIQQTGNKGQEMRIAMQRVSDMLLLTAYTPAYFVRTQNPDSIDMVLTKKYEKKGDAARINAANYMCQLQAIIQHDIYKSSGRKLIDMKDLIKAKMLIVVSLHDHLLNPASAIELSKMINCGLLELNTDYGHMEVFFEAQKLRDAAIAFLKK
jgi:homoserine O-acetyltransferase/O-succinyltransferase